LFFVIFTRTYCKKNSIIIIINPNPNPNTGYLSPSAGLKFADVPNGVAALGAVPLLGWLQVTLSLSFSFLSLNRGKSIYVKSVTVGKKGLQIGKNKLFELFMALS
jgi:hypothetical protein